MRGTDKALFVASVIVCVIANAVCIATWFGFVWHRNSIWVSLNATAVMGHSWVLVWLAKQLL